jgi:hypothetical protein
MARRAKVATARKPKPKVRLGKSAVASLNIKYYGNEPSVDDTDFHYETAYTWYNYNITDFKLAKEFLLTYLEETHNEHLSKISKIDEKTIYGYISTTCWRARLTSMGLTLPSIEIDRLNADLIFIQEKDAQLKEENTSRKYSEISPALSERNIEVINAIEDALDIFKIGTFNPKFDIQKCFNDNNIPEQLHGLFHSKILKDYSDILTLNVNNDISTFEDWTKKDIESRQMLIKNILIGINGSIDPVKKERKERAIAVPKTTDNVVKVRAARKKKPVPVSKKTAKIKYQEIDEELGIKSLKPEKLLNAKEAWIFNTKYKKMEYYYSDTGLDLKGASIIKFDETKSMGKKIGTRTKEKLNEFMTSSKLRLPKLLEGIKTLPLTNSGRMSENSVILRVF